MGCSPRDPAAAVPEPPAPVLEVIGVGKTYPGPEGPVAALRDFSLTLESGEIVGLLGPNGAGKTTAVKIIMGFIRADGGRVLCRGRELAAAEPRPGFGYLPENFRPNPNLTVAEYVGMQLSLAVGGRRPGREEVGELLAMTGMAAFGRRRICQLSKGMGQRVGLAQAFAGDPGLLLLDEPTSGLDPLGKARVIELLLAQKAAGRTIFFCSHILSEVEGLCDRIGVLVGGRLRFVGPVGDFCARHRAAGLEEAFKLEMRCALS